jgi:hypothetical protein
MSSWIRILTSTLAVAIVAALAGCSAAVDAEGKPVTGRVWFDADGVAHCPFCDPVVKMHVGKDDPPSTVGAVDPKHPDQRLPAGVHATVCDQEAHHHVVWASESITCYACGGTGRGVEVKKPAAITCPNESRPRDFHRPETCGYCAEKEAQAALDGTTSCRICGGTGMIRAGEAGARAY